jgi:hypothetical protein
VASKKIKDRTRHTTSCVFCGCKEISKLTQTHIWPSWLNELLAPPPLRLYELERAIPLSPVQSRAEREAKLWMGSIFAQKPYLCCVECNTGRQKKIEDEMKKFADPLFTGKGEILLDLRQLRVFSIWISVITVLAEYIDTSKSSITVSQSDKDFLRKNLRPPETWTIAACSLDSERWYARYRHQSLFVGQFESRAHYDATVMQRIANNSQISSFGMGRIFVQTFNCPDLRQVQDFRTWVRAASFVLLWPPPMRIWPFAAKSVRFPTNLVLNDDQAEQAAKAFHERLKVMTGPPFFGGQPIR